MFRTVNFEVSEGEKEEEEEGLQRSEKNYPSSQEVYNRRKLLREKYPLVVKFSYVPEGRESEADIVKYLRELAAGGESPRCSTISPYPSFQFP